ncbi:MAG TPA: GNAT family N-acetyltransferase, partial [Actinobacteria bacterium]|nr:GNAT family N-acetyltransferase [Actinomycetota bacterium]
MNVSGHWPNAVGLKSGWAKAETRPWNKDINDAHLRLIRGNTAFLERCVGTIGGFGVAGVTSPPLLQENRGIWERAGFEAHLELLLFRRSLVGGLKVPVSDVVLLNNPPWVRMVEIDSSAFDPVWRMSEAGLREAFDATNRSTVMATFDEEVLTGFTVVGTAGNTGYLQRVAVDPDQQGRGLGRALVRASMGWAVKRGATTMLLNTQPDNETSAKL